MWQSTTPPVVGSNPIERASRTVTSCSLFRQPSSSLHPPYSARSSCLGYLGTHPSLRLLRPPLLLQRRPRPTQQQQQDVLSTTRRAAAGCRTSNSLRAVRPRLRIHSCRLPIRRRLHQGPQHLDRPAQRRLLCRTSARSHQSLAGWLQTQKAPSRRKARAKRTGTARETGTGSTHPRTSSTRLSSERTATRRRRTWTLSCPSTMPSTSGRGTRS